MYVANSVNMFKNEFNTYHGWTDHLQIQHSLGVNISKTSSPLVIRVFAAMDDSIVRQC